MRLTVKDRATIAVLGVTALTLLLGAVSWTSLRELRIGGPISRELERRNALLQDAAPPPLFFVEGGMHLHQVAVTQDTVLRAANWVEYHKHLREFRESLLHYDTVFADDPDVRSKLHAMVAQEVKALAKQTSKATEETGAMIQAIQRDVQASVEAVSMREFTT